MTVKNKRKMASILFVLISITCLAQDDLPPPITPPGLEKPAPIDGGVLIGAFVALCYGTKKLLKNN